ncbi:MAG TPA: SulP family inorganic anion transporter [Pseudolabrys sp.]|nr:SulP family inorganic anion transporter [Pseudolabrys sp.]
MDPSAARAGTRPTFTDLFTPKLVTILREGYGAGDFKADIFAGLTVAIVALPLSMAIAIASGTTPDRGLYTAIIGGFLISLLGGSRFQIGGPAGAFIVLVAATVDRHGIDGLLLATVLAGIFLVIAGFLRLGTYIKFLPYPVTVGFTAAIAVIIAASQIKDLFGLTLAVKEPGELLPKLQVLFGASGTLNPAALILSVFTVALIVGIRMWRPALPGILIAVVAAALAVAVLGLPVETIGSHFGGIPQSLPAPALPLFSLERVQAILPDAAAFALLGAIESLLSAVVADGMTGRRHRSNCELVAQGVANIGSAIFGGICATGTIARTATNIRAGARGPVAGMLHSAFLLLFMLIAAPLASYIPLAALAAVLIVVAWNMAEKGAFATLIRTSRGDSVVLLATFLLTIFVDLMTGIVVGFAIGTLLFVSRMAQATGVEAEVPLVPQDKADDANGQRTPYDVKLATDPEVIVYRITGAFFFGVASAVGEALDFMSSERCKALVIDFSGVPFLDSTAANTIEGIARKARNRGIRLLVTGTTPGLRRVLVAHGVRPPHATYKDTIEHAIASAHALSRDEEPSVA